MKTFGLCQPIQSKDEQDRTSILILAIAADLFRNVTCPIVRFDISNMSSQVQFQLQSGYQVLPPRRRWDLCAQKLRQFRRRDPNLRVVGEGERRCRAQEFLLGLWQDFAMTVGSGRSTPCSEMEKN